MEEQVGVVDGIHTAVGENGADVLVELLGDAEGVVELLHEQGLLVGESVRGCGVDGGEVAGAHLVGLPVEFAEAFLIVDMVEEAAVVHLPFGMTLEDLGFLLELYHGDGLVHLGCELARLLVHLIAGQ